ncbi:hypothetical protein AB0L04_10235 [Streptomyces glaucescens]|uniref:hypothetical protein n=1 Tax=Streptomyces glaucescens TaxID=1907 RepID=UPI00344C3692
MTAVLVAAFLFLHGLVHLPVWLMRVDDNRRFDPRRSWALTAAGVPGARVVGATAIALASVTAMLYVVAGAAAAVRSDGWAAAAFLAACVGLALKAVWFHPRLSPGAVLDAAVLVAVLTSRPVPLY